MIRIRFAALLLFLATPLFAFRSLTADPPGVAPGGFQPVHLRSNGDVRFSSKATVTFGNVPGTVVQVVNDFDLLVVAPAHAPGFVTVTVRQDGQEFSTIEQFGYGMSEEVLLPIAVDSLPGANGSRWSTEIWVHNDADHAVPIDPEYCTFIGSWFPCSEPVTRIPAKSTVRLTGYGSAAYPYAFLYPPLQDADAVHYSIVVRELSTGQATPIAAVRAPDKRASRVVLPGIANDGRHRAALRLYGRSISTLVSIADAATGAVLTARTIRRLPILDADRFTLETLQGLFDAPELRGHDRLDVSIESQDGEALWALLTLTDNATQQVTLFTP